MSGKTYWGTPLRIVYDPQGREVHRTAHSFPFVEYFESLDVAAGEKLLIAAGYEVKEAPRMVEVELEGLEVVLNDRGSPGSDGSFFRLRAIVDRERGR